MTGNIGKWRKNERRKKTSKMGAGILINCKDDGKIKKWREFWSKCWVQWRQHTEAGSRAAGILSASILFPLVSLLPLYSWGGLPILHGTICEKFEFSSWYFFFKILKKGEIIDLCYLVVYGIEEAVLHAAGGVGRGEKSVAYKYIRKLN